MGLEFHYRRLEINHGIDAIGYQAITADCETEKPNTDPEALITVIRPTGGLGILGLHAAKDPGSHNSNSAMFPFGKLFAKGLTVGTGSATSR